MAGVYIHSICYKTLHRVLICTYLVYTPERGEDDQSPHKNGKPPEAKFKGIPDDLEKLTIRELKDIAGAYNKLPHTKDKIKNFGKLRKHELIEALSQLGLS